MQTFIVSEMFKRFFVLAALFSHHTDLQQIYITVYLFTAIFSCWFKTKTRLQL